MPMVSTLAEKIDFPAKSLINLRSGPQRGTLNPEGVLKVLAFLRFLYFPSQDYVDFSKNFNFLFFFLSDTLSLIAIPFLSTCFLIELKFAISGYLTTNIHQALMAS